MLFPNYNSGFESFICPSSKDRNFEPVAESGADKKEEPLEPIKNSPGISYGYCFNKDDNDPWTENAISTIRLMADKKAAYEIGHGENPPEKANHKDEGRQVLYGEVEQIKHDFAGNAVVVEGQGDFSNIPGVLETRLQNGEWHMALEPGTSPQDVFRALAARDGIKIERFEIAEPSLDDIFISVVQGEGRKAANG